MAKKTASEKRQRAELRVVFQRSTDAAVVMFVEVRGRDVYAGGSLGTSQLRLRSSYHESGQRHTYTPVGRFSKRMDTPVAAISGYKMLLQMTTAATDWTHVSKPDTDRRRTLVISEADFPDGACVMALAVESARNDIIAAFCVGAPFANLGVEVGSSLVADWIDPAIVLLALRMLPHHVATIRTGMQRNGGDPNEKMTGFILGPPAPNGVTWEMLGKVAADGTVTQFAASDS